MTKAVLNSSESQQGGVSDNDAGSTVNAFAGLPAQGISAFATTSSAQIVAGIMPLQTAEAAGALVNAAAASAQPLDLFDLGEFVPPNGMYASGLSGQSVIAPTLTQGVQGGQIAFVNVTSNGSGTYTVASGGFPAGAVGVNSSLQSSFSALKPGPGGGDTFAQSSHVRVITPNSSRANVEVGFNFFQANGVTNFSLVNANESSQGKFDLKSLSALGAVTLQDVKVLGWNSDSILLSFASSIDLHAGDTVGGGGDVVISTENMYMDAGSLPANTAFTTTGAHPVIDGTTVPCFAAGTRLATPSGEIAVETLAPGATVLTHDGLAETITWIGTRTVACHAHPRPEKVWPVRVRRHAFGPDLPKRDLILSPDHSIFVEGVLIPVCELVNGSSVVQERVHSIRYLHVECALHTIILAEGLPVESLLDLGDHRQFENGEGPMSLHADFTALAWEASCVPLKLHGPEVDAARALLCRNAAEMRAAA